MRSITRRAIARTAMLILLTGCVVVNTAYRVPRAGEGRTPEGAYFVVVTAPGSADDAYRRAALALQDEGFALDRTDEVLRTLTTEPRQVKGEEMNSFLIELSITATVVERTAGTVIRLSGRIGDDRVTPLAGERSQYGVGWRTLVHLGTLIGGEMTYE